eukprot:TRINITY_DN111115_c0_g1_i1.p2 TRINITY_DN111115_c0_g1~~TRINITY_DN111115_c0_g1_i1.p2  ORF type:complete len:164 (+),score=2.99 TRINITY_DN111115_c0_g1_i1:118-609(+)
MQHKRNAGASLAFLWSSTFCFSPPFSWHGAQENELNTPFLANLRSLIGSASATGSQENASLDVYRDYTLSGFGPKQRGQVIQSVLRRRDQQVHRSSEFGDPPAPRKGTIIYDWMRDGLRIESKSAQLRWAPSLNRWRALFYEVKQGSFDERNLPFAPQTGYTS